MKVQLYMSGGKVKWYIEVNLVYIKWKQLSCKWWNSWSSKSNVMCNLTDTCKELDPRPVSTLITKRNACFWKHPNLESFALLYCQSHDYFQSWPTLFSNFKKRNFSPWIFPGAQGQGHVTWGHEKCMQTFKDHERTMINFEMRFLASCYHEHCQNDV